jgi:hypothetical protein
MTENTTLRGRVESRVDKISNDPGSYDFHWLDELDADTVAFQLDWFREAIRDCEIEGFEESAAIYAQMLAIVEEELTAEGWGFAFVLYGIDPMAADLRVDDRSADLFSPLTLSADEVRAHVDLLRHLRLVVSSGSDRGDR